MQKNSIIPTTAYAISGYRAPNRDDLGASPMSMGLVLQVGGWVATTYGMPYQASRGGDHLVVMREGNVKEHEAAPAAEAQRVTAAQAKAYFQFAKDHQYGTTAHLRADAREALDFPKGWRATVLPSRAIIAPWGEYATAREAYLKREQVATERRAESVAKNAADTGTIVALAKAAGIDLNTYVSEYGSEVRLSKAVLIDLLQRIAAK